MKPWLLSKALKGLRLFPECTNPDQYNPESSISRIPNPNKAPPTPEGCIPGPRPRELGTIHPDQKLVSRDWGIQEIDAVGIVSFVIDAGNRGSVALNLFSSYLLIVLLGLKNYCPDFCCLQICKVDHHHWHKREYRTLSSEKETNIFCTKSFLFSKLPKES